MLYTIGEILILLILAALLGVLLGWLIWGRRSRDLHSQCETSIADLEDTITASTAREQSLTAELEAAKKDHAAALAASTSIETELESERARFLEASAALEESREELHAARAEAEELRLGLGDAESELTTARSEAASAERARADASAALEEEQSRRLRDTAAEVSAAGAHLFAAPGSSRAAAEELVAEELVAEELVAEELAAEELAAESEAVDAAVGVAYVVDDTPSALGFSAARPVAGVAAITEPDDLEIISGIGPKLNALLIERGIVTFRQLAVMTEDEIDLLDASLPDFNGRVRREKWIDQAHGLHREKHGNDPQR